MNKSEHIKMAMINKGISQKELSELSGISETTISHTLSGKTKPNSGTIFKLGTAMGFPSFSKLIQSNEE